MRYIKLFILLSISSGGFAQTLQFYNLGQSIPANKNACLVIKNNSKALTRLPLLIKEYKPVTIIKIVGFNSNNFSLDSLMRSIEPLNKLTYIIFENCDLSSSETSFENFKELDKIAILKQSVLFENTFFPLLKNNKITQLYIQTNDPDIITDSLHLLPHIKSIQIGSTALFNKPNHITSIHIKNENTSQTIDLVYFGDFYKSNNYGVKSNKPGSKPLPFSVSYKSKLDCIKQPIPGININDTTFGFSSSQKANFTYKSGTTLSIDRNAFVTQSGEKYSGNVKLFYREFRNPVEIMLSGIPMTNNVNGKEQIFKSGGMYEINAFDASNKALNLVSDTSIKINFALTDTSQNFQFFSLNNDGSWATVTNSITVNPASSSSFSATKAVQEYFSYLRAGNRFAADTTRFNNRFYSSEYLYTYRKNNFSSTKSKKNNDTSYIKEYKYKKKNLKASALFRVKYSKLTKDKQIVYTIVPAKKYIYIPAHIRALMNKTYLYNGTLTKDEFKKMFNKKLLCWDVRTSLDDNVITMDIKTEKMHQALSGQIIYLRDDKTFTIQKKATKFLNQKVARFIRREAKKFDKTTRFDYYNFNDINYINNNGKNKDLLAFTYSKKYQNNKEKPMDFKTWKLYVKPYSNLYMDRYSLEQTNELGTALLKSGLGAKNIDCYLHNGSMEDIYVRYNNILFDTLSYDYNTVLFKSINTNYLLSNSSNNSLTGYYYKNNPNYIIRFSDKGFMQVSKPGKVSENKKSNVITLDYVNQFNVKGMNSNDITKLILD